MRWGYGPFFGGLGRADLGRRGFMDGWSPQLRIRLPTPGFLVESLKRLAAGFRVKGM